MNHKLYYPPDIRGKEAPPPMEERLTLSVVRRSAMKGTIVTSRLH